ncbi:MAG TPA: site-2 protease family protein [Kofleriaceae bacterium]|nr:site-2 protease family protein [Kofleriaceae bacterium]
MDLSAQQIRGILIGLFVLLVSVALHEFGHAIMAYKLGDDTPKRQGRVTLNPLAHADPIGTFLLPLVSGIIVASGAPSGGFGWGKPVQWQPHRIRRGIKVSTANILVSFAGPAMNLVLAVVVATVSVVLISLGVGSIEIHKILLSAVATNFVLFFFNLLPIPPLDGGHIAQAFLPYRHREKFESYARYAPFLLLAMMMIPELRFVFTRPALWCAAHLYSGLGSIVGI